jgi:hypothetical protein
MSILYRTLSQIVPDGLEKREALTREAGYTTGSFVACRYHIELCRRFRQMAKELQQSAFPARKRSASPCLAGSATGISKP